jgi:crotonobetainyl-CoA:carnitine CoA-transferase CaiB-like acyl-CoA transferase
MATGKPLDGLRIVEIGHSVAVPFAGLILSDLGAEPEGRESQERRPWLADDRCRKNADRVAHREILLAMIEAVAREEALTDLAGRLDALGIPNAPLQGVGEVAAHPQTQALGILQAGPEGSLPSVGLPITLGGERPAPRWGTPGLGEHNCILRDAADRRHA